MQSWEQDMKDAGCSTMSEYLEFILKESQKQKEAFRKKPRLEQINIELEQVWKDYGACVFVGNTEGIEECQLIIRQLEEEQLLLSQENQHETN